MRPALFLLLLVTAAACGGDASDGLKADPADTAAKDITATADPDVRFIDRMAPHHQMAIEMADLALRNAEDADLKALAKQIKQDQMVDLAAMKQAKQELVGADETAPMTMDEPFRARVDSMNALTGAAFEELWLRSMIRHHQDGIRLAEEARPNLTRPDLQQITRTMLEKHPAEIQTMQQMRAE